MELLVLILIAKVSALGIISFFMYDEGTKGIEREPYFGRRTGTRYTAKKSREKHLV